MRNVSHLILIPQEGLMLCDHFVVVVVVLQSVDDQDQDGNEEHILASMVDFRGIQFSSRSINFSSIETNGSLCQTIDVWTLRRHRTLGSLTFLRDG
jgi:hypothetical protein